MKNIITLFISLAVLFSSSLMAQDNDSTQTESADKIYTFERLSQESVQVISSPLPSIPKEVGDTSFTIYEGASVPLKYFFVHGAEYDNIFNPHPTGIFIGEEKFVMFCDQEKAVQQPVNMFLDIKEFFYLGKTYLAFISLWENCDGATCRYRCYNLFDITDTKDIKQYSFNSIYDGLASIGEFNNDGLIDFLRAAPKAPKSAFEDGTEENYYYITAYTIKEGKSIQLHNDDKSNYYLYCYGDDMLQQFEILQADWFYTIIDSSGNVAPKKPYFAPYVSFDPYESYLYDAQGFRMEKKRYSIHIATLGDVEGAVEESQAIAEMMGAGVYIMPDQYSGDISFRIMAGNFLSKEPALNFQKKLNDYGIEGELFDFRKSW